MYIYIVALTVRPRVITDCYIGVRRRGAAAVGLTILYGIRAGGKGQQLLRRRRRRAKPFLLCSGVSHINFRFPSFITFFRSAKKELYTRTHTTRIYIIQYADI